METDWCEQKLHHGEYLLWDRQRGKVQGMLKTLNKDNSLYWNSHTLRGWSGGAMVLGKLPVPGRPTNLD